MVRGSKITLNKATSHEVSNQSTLTPTFQEGFSSFIRYCKAKNLRDKTIQNYNEHFAIFINYIKNYTTLRITKDLKQTDIENYILFLRNKNIRETSINCYLRSLRSITNYWVKTGLCHNVKVQLSKADKKQKEIYTDDELLKLLQKPNISKCDFTTYRNWCIINFFVATGVRVSTLINIKIEDLDFKYERILLSYTKSRKSYYVPMSNQLKDVLEEYLFFRKGDSNDYLFCNPYGEQMTADSVKHAISKYNKARGVERKGLHAFRHTFAKKCVLNGVNVFVLQRLMGHSDLSVTKEYIDLNANDLAVNINLYNPLETLTHPTTTNQAQKKQAKRKKIRLS